MNNRDIRVIFLYKFNLGRTAENINLAFEEGHVNVRTFQRWCAKFNVGDFSLENEPDRAVDDNVLRKIIENNPQ
ncbi:Histone-lysine N-methyltransferase SETMAR [Habropoda laboriosa]|uniref:Histone-lysine N-methyltransferase SETMAR n=1 Tax=Habropoda laboriosa TaxID=597456 RepID=A0A0L7QSF5_9HYME|nr:Histone-lysine N-methyltransferase SETMAR [Habropoda laboriosa]